MNMGLPLVRTGETVNVGLPLVRERGEKSEYGTRSQSRRIAGATDGQKTLVTLQNRPVCREQTSSDGAVYVYTDKL